MYSANVANHNMHVAALTPNIVRRLGQKGGRKPRSPKLHAGAGTYGTPGAGMYACKIKDMRI